MSQAVADVQRMRDYLANRMPDEDARTFEARLEREPALVAELETALRLQGGLAALDRQHRLQRHLRGRSPFRSQWVVSAIAAALVGIALSIWVFRTSHAPTAATPVLLAAAVEPVSAEYTFRALRGASQPPALELPARGVIELRIAPSESVPGARYAMTLEKRDRDGVTTPITTLSDLASDEHGLVHGYVSAASLPPGAYALVASPADSAAAAESFFFTLARPAPARDR